MQATTHNLEARVTNSDKNRRALAACSAHQQRNPRRDRMPELRIESQMSRIWWLLPEATTRKRFGSKNGADEKSGGGAKMALSARRQEKEKILAADEISSLTWGSTKHKSET
jgi:nitric oxide reductase activation protein